MSSNNHLLFTQDEPMTRSLETNIILVDRNAEIENIVLMCLKWALDLDS